MSYDRRFGKVYNGKPINKSNIKEKINIEFEFKLDKLMFNKDGFIIARVTSTSSEISDYLNPIWHNVGIKGKMPKLKHKLVYVALATQAESSQYGWTLDVENVYPRDLTSENMTTDKQLLEFIDVFIGEGTSKKLKGVKGICEIVKNQDMDSLLKIKGIGNKIAQKIMDTYNTYAVGSTFIVKLKKLGFTDNEVKKLEKMYNKNLMLAYEQIEANIFRLVYCGFRLDRMDKIYLEGLQGNSKNKHRIQAYIYKALKDAMYEKYKSYITLEQFYQLGIIQNIIANVGQVTFDKCLKEFIKEERGKIVNNEIITTHEEWKIETDLVSLLEEITQMQPKQLDIDDLDADIDEEEKKVGFKLNEGQRQAVKEIITSNKSLCMLNGFAGTGKSTVTRFILNIYAKYGYGNFKLCALSGRASSILGESSGYSECANTIHRTLGNGAFRNRQWYYDYDNKFNELDILLVDEISMVDYYLLYSILSPVDNGTKVIVLGDRGQLPSLNFGKPIETLQMFDIQLNELTQVMRQSEDSYILQVANEVRQGKNPFQNTKYVWMGTDTEVCIGDSYNYMIKSFVEKFVEEKSSIVVTTTKANTDMINFDIQEMLLQQKILKPSKEFMIKPSSTKDKYYKIYENDYVMVLKNNYDCVEYDYSVEEFDEVTSEDFEGSFNDIAIFNGEIYRVKLIRNGLVILTDEETDILVEIDELQCQLAYASNCHKCQGSGFKNVFVYTSSSYVDRKMITSSEWLYTAYTRSKEFLSIHTEQFSNLREGINRKAINEKVTLIEYLHEH